MRNVKRPLITVPLVCVFLDSVYSTLWSTHLSYADLTIAGLNVLNVFSRIEKIGGHPCRAIADYYL